MVDVNVIMWDTILGNFRKLSRKIETDARGRITKYDRDTFVYYMSELYMDCHNLIQLIDEGFEEECSEIALDRVDLNHTTIVDLQILLYDILQARLKTLQEPLVKIISKIEAMIDEIERANLENL